MIESLSREQMPLMEFLISNFLGMLLHLSFVGSGFDLR